MTASVRAMGWKAHAALARANARRCTDLPDFAGSSYRLAHGEPIWIGAGDVAMHPRAVVFHALAAATDTLCLGAIVPWRVAPWRLPDDGARALLEGAAALAADVYRIGVPQGLAVLLTGRQPTFPLDQAARHVSTLGRAIDGDDAQLAFAAALPLLGLGPGLTPSGDDFVGAALFARRQLGMDARWAEVAQRLIDAAQTRTHAIGAALFRDLAEGQSFGPLHRLAAVLAARAPALAVARDVAAIGHSSGWDMLAGFVTGVAGSAVLPTVRGNQ